MPLLACLIGLMLTAGPVQARRNTTRHCFNGYGYNLDGGPLRYIEHHEQILRNGRPIDWTITYYTPRGQVIARKQMDFSDNPTVPIYTLRIPALGYVEGIRHDDGQWLMFRRNGPHAGMKTQPFRISSEMAADAGFDALVKKNFKALMQGHSVGFKFAVAGHLSVIDMVAKKTDTTTFENKPAVVFKVSLDSFFLNLFVNPLLLTYDPDSRRLLEYRGIGNLRNAKGKVYPVRVSYYRQTPPAAKGSGISADCNAATGNSH